MVNCAPDRMAKKPDSVAESDSGGDMDADAGQTPEPLVPVSNSPTQNDDDANLEETMDDAGSTVLEEGHDVIDDDDDDDDDFIQEMSSVQFLNHEGQVYGIQLINRMPESVRSHVTSDGDQLAPQSSVAMTSCVSGGEDDCAYEWDPRDGHVIRKFGGFSDSVTVVSLNANRTLLALGAMDGLIRIYKLGQDAFCQEYQVGDLEWVDWHPGGADILIAGTADGDIWMYLVNASGNSSPGGSTDLSPAQCKVMASPGCACTAGTFLPDGKRLAAGYKDGTLRIWDLKATSAKLVPQKHEAAVTQICANPDGTLIASGSEDGMLLVTHADNYRDIGRYQFPLRATPGDPLMPTEDGVEEAASSVEAIVFAPSMPFVIFGGVNTDVVILDLNTCQIRTKCPHDRGVTLLKFSPLAPCVVYSAGIDGVLRAWDIRDGRLVSAWTGHMNEILDFDFDCENKRIMTAGADNFCRVFEVIEQT